MKKYGRGDYEPPKIVETTEQARQGVTGQGVRYVLLFGLLGVIAAVAVWLAAFAR
ncbi:MAG: hypothetical protein ACT4SY_08245 [Hyphomicrobiales bacterium]